MSKRFPVSQTLELPFLYSESMPLRSTYASFDGVRTPNQTLFGVGPNPSKVWWVSTITFSSTLTIEASITFGSSSLAAGGALAPGFRFTITGGETLIIPVNQFVYEGENISATCISGSDGSSFEAKMGLNGYQLTNDFNYSASKTILMIGDSISNGTAGVTRGENLYQFILRNNLYKDGISCRVVTKGNGGFTSSNIDYLRAIGRLNIQDPGLILYNLGMNDVPGNMTAFQSNLPKILEWKQTFYKDIPMIVLGPSRRRDAQEANLQILREFSNQTVEQLGDSTITFFDLGPVIPDDATYYATSDAVHPNDDGHALLGTALTNYVKSNISL